MARQINRSKGHPFLDFISGSHGRVSRARASPRNLRSLTQEHDEADLFLSYQDQLTQPYDMLVSIYSADGYPVPGRWEPVNFRICIVVKGMWGNAGGSAPMSSSRSIVIYVAAVDSNKN